MLSEMRKCVLAVFGIVNLISSCNKGEPPSSQSDNSPVITSISPISGVYNTVVTIAGKNFSTIAANDTVRFNNKEASILSAKSDTLIVSVPISAGTGAVEVTVNNRTTTGSVFSYVTSLIVTTFAGTGVPGHKDGPADVAQFGYPDGIAVDGQNNLFVGDLNCIRKIKPDGTVSTLAGGSPGYSDGRGDTTRFSNYLGIAVDGQGNVFVADRANSCIRKITPDGMVTTVAGNPTYGYLDGIGTNAKFWEVWDVAVDLQGNLYVTDRSNQRIRKITPGGIVSTLAGDGQWGYLDGQGLSAEFFDPYGIEVDKQGNVYVADNWNMRIRKISPSGSVTTLAGNGIASYYDGAGSIAMFSDVFGICIDNEGTLFVTDDNNQLIRKIRPDGFVSTLAGSHEDWGFLDGPADKAKFNYPRGIAVDGMGNVFVVDTKNFRIRKISMQ